MVFPQAWLGLTMDSSHKVGSHLGWHQMSLKGKARQKPGLGACILCAEARQAIRDYRGCGLCLEWNENWAEVSCHPWQQENPGRKAAGGTGLLKHSAHKPEDQNSIPGRLPEMPGMAAQAHIRNLSTGKVEARGWLLPPVWRENLSPKIKWKATEDDNRHWLLASACACTCTRTRTHTQSWQFLGVTHRKYAEGAMY